MATQVVTQLIVDSQGAVAGVAAFEAAMARAKGSTENLTAPIKTFDQAQRDLGRVMAANNPVFAAQLKMQAEMERTNVALTNSVKLGQISQSAANAEMAQTVKRHEANIQAIKEHTGQLTSGERAMVGFRGAISGVSGNLIAMSAGLGPVGVALAGLGPFGLAAAASLALLSAVFEEAKRTARALAEEAVNLEKFAETTGLSTDTLQALTQAAAKHGVQADQVTTSIVRFTSAWAEARDGGGVFLAQLRLIDPVLAAQIQRTKDSATALGLLTQAIHQADVAGDIAHRNQLLRAAGGRGGVVAFTGISTAVNEAGGLGNLTQDAVDAGRAIDSHLLKEIRDLKAELDETRKLGDLLFGSIGAKPIFEAELAWEKLRVSMARTVLELEKGESKLGPWERWFAQMARIQNGGDLSGFLLPPPPQQPAPIRLPSLSLAGIASTVGTGDLSMKSQVEALKEQITLMGGAATAAEKLNLKLLELKAGVAANASEENKLAAERGKAAAILDNVIDLESRRLALLGPAASVEEQVAQKMRQVNKENEINNNLKPAEIANIKRLETERASGTAGILQQIDALKIQAATLGLSAGESAKLHAIMTLQLQDMRTGHVATWEEIQDRIKAAEVLGKQAQALEELRIKKQLAFETATLFMPQEEVAIAQKLAAIYPKVSDALASAEAAQMRFNAAMNDVEKAGRTFVTDFVKGLLAGKTAMESLANAADNLFKKLAEMATNDGLNALMALATGNFAGAAFYGIRAGIESVGAALSKWLGDTAKHAAEASKRIQELAKADAAARALTSSLGGAGSGSIVQHVSDVSAQVQSVLASYHGAVTQAGTELFNTFTTFVYRTFADFRNNWESLLSQLGDNSAFAQANANVSKFAQSVIDFVNNTRDLGTSEQVVRAQAAGRKSLLSLLDPVVALSAAATEMERINGTAAALKSALMTLGMSADDAAKAINTGVTHALINLRTSFVTDINRSINSATGKGFLNDFSDLFAQVEQQRRDALSLGADPALINRFFEVQAQKIVDDAGLMGDAFTDLVKVFPQLTGVVHESTTAVQQAADAQKKAIEEAQNFIGGISRQITQYLDHLKVSAGSPLSPAGQLTAAQSAFGAQLSLAQGGDRNALSGITQYASDLLAAAKSVFASSAGFQAIYNQITASLTALPGQVSPEQLIVNAIVDMKTALSAAITAGPQSTASALSAYFNAIDANTSQSIDFNEMKAALGGMATDSALHDMFTRLDTDNSGSLDKLELIRTATGATKTSNDQINAQVTAAAHLDIDIKAATEAVKAFGAAGVLDAIKGLNTTASDQLVLLTSQLTAGDVTTSTGGFHWDAATHTLSTNSVVIQNNMLSALNKIVWNTNATAQNTKYALSSGVTNFGLFGTYASGGWVGGVGTGTSDSNLIRASRGEYIVQESAASRWGPQLEAINAGRFPFFANDNSSVAAEIAALRAEVAALRREQSVGLARSAQASLDAGGMVADEMGRQTNALVTEERQSRNKPRQAA